MKLKLNWKLFGYLYLIILSMYVLQFVFLGTISVSTDNTIATLLPSPISYLLIHPFIAFLKACAVILVAYIIFIVIRDNKDFKEKEDTKKK